MNTRLRSIALIALAIIAGCKNGDGSSMPFQTVGKQPDVAPVMLNKELPFRYPPALYAQKVQGNVTLRIFIDRDGAIVADSTRIAETSGFTALDSAAMSLPSSTLATRSRFPKLWNWFARWISIWSA